MQTRYSSASSLFGLPPLPHSLRLCGNPNHPTEQPRVRWLPVDEVAGVTPWILADFRSPRRNLPRIQDGWNRKGLVSQRGRRKLAFGTLRAYYARKAAAGGGG